MGDVNAMSMLTMEAERNELLLQNHQLRADKAELTAALGRIEFAGPHFQCNECKGQPSCGHEANCVIGVVLAKNKEG